MRVTVETDVTYPNLPCDPQIDTAKWVKDLQQTGYVDLNSLRVIDVAQNEVVPHAIGNEFADSDKGRLKWLISSPESREFQIRFHVRPQRIPLSAGSNPPLIGTGDLLRHSSTDSQILTVKYPGRFIDLNGDGRRDIAGVWNYAYAPDVPWDGLICHQRIGKRDQMEFGEQRRLKYLKDGSEHHFRGGYMAADFADLDGDDLPDIVLSKRNSSQLEVYLNTGQYDRAGMPLFVADVKIPRPSAEWNPCRIVDVDQDGSLDIMIGGHVIRNRNKNGWPIEPDKSIALAEKLPGCFYDVDRDGMQDLICLIDGPATEPRARKVGWCRRTKMWPPQFDASQLLKEITVDWCWDVAAVNDGSRSGLLVQHGPLQQLTFFLESVGEARKTFADSKTLMSPSAVIALGDQAWPAFADWDDDGDMDLIAGGGYGWAKLLINQSQTSSQFSFQPPKFLQANGKQLRILRDEVLSSQHWHNMGYLCPRIVDWDSDGLSDLVVPNETNRIFWYRNVGTRSRPQLGERQQILCEGYPDGPEARKQSALRAADTKRENHPYPYEAERPFLWRTGVAIADYTNDGLPDLITHDGHTRKATLFVQYRDDQQGLRLRKTEPIQLVDGRLIDDRIVARRKHWTESFQAIDWDRDGLQDLVYACAGAAGGIQDNGSIYLLRNCGTKQAPKFELPRTFCCYGEPIQLTAHGPHPWVGDFDGDGLPDLVACVEWSVYPVYRHAALEMAQQPMFRFSKPHQVGSDKTP